MKNKIVAATANDNQYHKVRKIHNWLVKNLEYEETSDSADKYSIYGPLRQAKGVCEGYARSFKYLLDAVGVPCVLVSGTATDRNRQEQAHAWNYVQMNNRWYAVDVTWDDPVIIGGGEITDELRYQYFLKGSEEFLKDHKEDGTLSESSIKFTFPVLETKNCEQTN